MWLFRKCLLFKSWAIIISIWVTTYCQPVLLSAATYQYYICKASLTLVIEGSSTMSTSWSLCPFKYIWTGYSNCTPIRYLPVGVLYRLVYITQPQSTAWSIVTVVQSSQQYSCTIWFPRACKQCHVSFKGKQSVQHHLSSSKVFVNKAFCWVRFIMPVKRMPMGLIEYVVNFFTFNFLIEVCYQ